MARRSRILHRKEPEKVVGEGIITKIVPGTLTHPMEISKDTLVQVGCIINTPIGLRYRLYRTTRWVGQEFIECQYNPGVVVDYVKIAANHDNRSQTQIDYGQTVNRLKPCQVHGKPRDVSKVRHGYQGRTEKKMDKKDLKSAISGLTAGDRLSVTFLSTMPTGTANTRYDGIREYAGKTVEFTMVGTKKGRGKGGSQLMVLKTDDDRTVVTGTPHSDVLVNMVTPAGMVGHESESAVPQTYETSTARASELKAQFKDLVGKTGVSVRVESTVSKYNGTFTMKSAELLKGRYGQVKLTLEQAGETLELWSYRHSGIVTSVEVLGATAEA